MADAVYRIQATDDTQAGVDSAEQNLEGLGESGGRVFGGLEAGALGFAAGLATVAAGVAFLNSRIENATQIQRFADIARVSTDEIQELGFVARQTGGDTEDLTDALREMQLRLSEAAALGSGPAVDALHLLGIELRDLEDLDSVTTFELLRDAISQVEDPARRLFLAEELLGGSTERLQGTLALTAQQYAAFRREARETGQVLDEEAIRKSMELGVELGNLQIAFGNAAHELLVESGLVSGLTNLAEVSADALGYFVDNEAVLVGALAAIAAALTAAGVAGYTAASGFAAAALGGGAGAAGAAAGAGRFAVVGGAVRFIPHVAAGLALGTAAVAGLTAAENTLYPQGRPEGIDPTYAAALEEAHRRGFRGGDAQRAALEYLRTGELPGREVAQAIVPDGTALTSAAGFASQFGVNAVDLRLAQATLGAPIVRGRGAADPGRAAALALGLDGAFIPGSAGIGSGAPEATLSDLVEAFFAGRMEAEADADPNPCIEIKNEIDVEVDPMRFDERVVRVVSDASAQGRFRNCL